MIWMTLALLVGPESADAQLTLRPGSNPVPIFDRSCDARIYQTRGPSPALRRLDEAAEGSVRMYYLMENRVNGCSVPVVAVETLPEADRAIGREIPTSRP